MFKELFIESLKYPQDQLDEASANGYLLSLKTYINDDRVKREVQNNTKYVRTKEDFFKYLNTAILKAMEADDGSKLPSFIEIAAANAIRQKSREMEKIVLGSKLASSFSGFGKTGRQTSSRYL